MASVFGQNDTILVIRIGAMGDIIHALPAVASLKRSFPSSKLVWLVAQRWTPLLAGNPFIDDLILFERSGIGALRSSWQSLRGMRPSLAIDFQGLVQSAIAGRAAQPRVFFGFNRAVAREPLACVFYTRRIAVTGPHRIQRNIQLVKAAGASQVSHQAWLPPGDDDGRLPSGPFVLTSPFAGWTSKQWPMECYELLGQRLKKEGLELVANVSKEKASELAHWKHVRLHSSTLSGLIAATRRAEAVVGLDSGPLHLAAALNKPGVALFGPTDPRQTGPFGGSIQVIRAANIETTYKRDDRLHPSMMKISVEQVSETLLNSLAAAPVRNL